MKSTEMTFNHQTRAIVVLSALTLILILSLPTFAQDRCNESRLSHIPECDLPKDIHPCQTAVGHELGIRFSANCHLGESKVQKVKKKKRVRR